MPEAPNAPATGRNSKPIFKVLKIELANVRSVLEIGSGTGQHAVYFAAKLPKLTWQTSDRIDNHDGIHAWIASASLHNVLPPMDLDVMTWAESDRRYDAVFSANTAHIMGIDAVAAMFRVVAGSLNPHGIFCLYGPFNSRGRFTSESNERFDRSLRSQNSAMGIRDIEDLDIMAFSNGMKRARTYAMPANNQLAVWKMSPQRTGMGVL
jgi:cyclopropane fatty-acyl-phospholipid synthase-like methyltransferase